MPTQNFKFDQFTQDITHTGRENLEAFFKSGAIFAKGLEGIVKTVATLSQTAVEKQGQYAKEMMGSKTLNEATETQAKIAQSSFDEFMAGAIKISEMSVKLLNEAATPLNEQMTKAMQKTTKMAA